MTAATTRRTFLILGGGVGLQIAAWLAYRTVQRRREERSSPQFAYDLVDPPQPLPSLTFENPQGEAVHVDSFGEQPLLLHFWATWCAPCRTELPSLLKYATTSSVPLLLVSLDENWEVVRHYFSNTLPAQVVRDTTRLAATKLRVTTLPETVLVRAASIVARVRGARNWQMVEGARAISSIGLR